MFPRWFDPHARFEDHEDMAQRRRGPGPGGPGPGAPPGPGGPPPPHWGDFRNLSGFLGNMFGRARARRGNVRSAILTLLAEGPSNGYQIMQAIEQRSNGQWKPSSGSIYPTLQQLEDEDLVEEEVKPGQSGSKSYRLSAKGRRYVDTHRAELEAEWSPATEDPGLDPRLALMNQFRQVAGAAMQVAQSGTVKQIEEAKRLLDEVRRNMYRILAEMPGDEDE